MEMRKTKAQTEAAGKAQLRQRVMDIAFGAGGGCDLTCCEVDGSFYAAMDPDDFFRFIQAVNQSFFREDNTTALEIWNLHHFATIDSAVEHLWACGVRA